LPDQCAFQYYAFQHDAFQVGPDNLLVSVGIKGCAAVLSSAGMAAGAVQVAASGRVTMCGRGTSVTVSPKAGSLGIEVRP
jgi:hypothetical protein